MVNLIEQPEPAVLPCSGNSQHLTLLFRCAGLAHVVSVSPAFARLYGLTANAKGLDQNYDLAWTVRWVVVGLLPSRMVATPLGEGLLVEVIAMVAEKSEPVTGAVLILPGTTTLQLLLPHELNGGAEALPKVFLVENNGPSDTDITTSEVVTH